MTQRSLSPAPPAGIPADAEPAQSGPESQAPGELAPLESRRASRLHWPDLLLAGVVLAQLALVFAFPIFPTQDGPAHLHNADVLARYASSPLFQHYYTLSFRPIPNLGGHLLLAGLLLVLPPLLADKVLLGIFVIALPVSARYALAGLNRPLAPLLTLLILPFTFGYATQMGFYNFCFGVVAFFLTLGVFLRHGERPTLRWAIRLSASFLLLYLCHLFAFAIGAVAIAFLAGAESLSHLREGKGLRLAMLTLGAVLPAAVLVLFFHPTVSSAATEGWDSGLSLVDMLVALPIPASIISFESADLVPATITGILLLSLFVAALVVTARSCRLQPADALLLLAGLLLTLFLRSTDAASSMLLTAPRFNLFFFLAVILFLAARPPARAILRVCCVAAVLAAMLMLGLRFRVHARLNRQLGELTAAAEHIPPGEAVVTLSLAPGGIGRDGAWLVGPIQPFRHAGGYVAALRHGVDLCNYEPATGFFPVDFRPELNPWRQLASDFALDQPWSPPTAESRIDLLSYPLTTSGRADYVLLFAPGAAENATIADVLRQLSAAYRPVFTAPHVTLYQRSGVR